MNNCEKEMLEKYRKAFKELGIVAYNYKKMPMEIEAVIEGIGVYEVDYLVLPTDEAAKVFNECIHYFNEDINPRFEEDCYYLDGEYWIGAKERVSSLNSTFGWLGYHFSAEKQG